MTTETTVSVRRSPLWIRILLGVSLALNLAIAGLVVGAGLRLIGPYGPPAPHTFGGALIRALPHDDRREIGFRARDSLGPRPDYGAGAAKLITALRITPFDAAAVEVILNAQSVGRAAWSKALQDSWLIHVSDMSENERLGYAQRLEEAEKKRAELRDYSRRKDGDKDKDRRD